MNFTKARQYIEDHPDISPKEGSEKFGVHVDTYRRWYKKVHGHTFTNRQKKDEPTVDPITEKRTGFDIPNDNVVINWSTRTVITDLGEFGNYVCSFSRHGAIMRAYSDHYEGKGDTQAEIAMRFDFSHAKAVAKYMRAHGMTKSMIGQTDIEFADGLDLENAIEENIQALKRKVTKETEKAKWRQIQKWADKWIRFQHNVAEPLRDWYQEHDRDYPTLTFKETERGNFAVVVGMSDWHYMKHVYNSKGESIYNRETARQLIFEHAAALMGEISKHGIPEKIFVPAGGNDNLHIDNTEHTTTKGTPQHEDTDGLYRLHIGQYLDLTFSFIEAWAQVADVEVIPFTGNHSEQTDMLVGAFMRKYFASDPRINVEFNAHTRWYYQYGRNNLMFTHGHHLSNNRLKKKIHQIIMGEARAYGIALDETDEHILFTGHDHVGSSEDLNGLVQHVIMPSLSLSDDFWHHSKGYVGRRARSQAYLIDKEDGMYAVLNTRTKQI